MTQKTTLQNTVNTVEKIQDKRSSTYVGSNELFDSTSVNTYTKELQRLSHAEASASLSIAGLTKAQRQQVMTALGAVTVLKSLTAEEVQERLAKKLNSEKRAAIQTKNQEKRTIW